jgi:hypothetical protein
MMLLLAWTNKINLFVKVNDKNDKSDRFIIINSIITKR